MSAFMQQLPALMGVVIGALGPYLAPCAGTGPVPPGADGPLGRAAARRVLRLRPRPEGDHHPHLPDRGPPGQRPNPHPLSPEDAAPELASALAARDPYWEALLMLGTPEVVERARDWAQMAVAMEQFLHTGAHDPQGWAALPARRREARDRYYVAVREDLALPPGHSGRWTPDLRRTTAAPIVSEVDAGAAR